MPPVKPSVIKFVRKPIANAVRALRQNFGKIFGFFRRIGKNSPASTAPQATPKPGIAPKTKPVRSAGMSRSPALSPLDRTSVKPAPSVNQPQPPSITIANSNQPQTESLRFREPEITLPEPTAFSAKQPPTTPLTPSNDQQAIDPLSALSNLIGAAVITAAGAVNAKGKAGNQLPSTSPDAAKSPSNPISETTTGTSSLKHEAKQQPIHKASIPQPAPTTSTAPNPSLQAAAPTRGKVIHSTEHPNTKTSPAPSLSILNKPTFNGPTLATDKPLPKKPKPVPKKTIERNSKPTPASGTPDVTLPVNPTVPSNPNPALASTNSIGKNNASLNHVPIGVAIFLIVCLAYLARNTRLFNRVFITSNQTLKPPVRRTFISSGKSAVQSDDVIRAFDNFATARTNVEEVRKALYDQAEAYFNDNIQLNTFMLLAKTLQKLHLPDTPLNDFFDTSFKSAERETLTANVNKDGEIVIFKKDDLKLTEIFYKSTHFSRLSCDNLEALINDDANTISTTHQNFAFNDLSLSSTFNYPDNHDNFPIKISLLIKITSRAIEFDSDLANSKRDPDAASVGSSTNTDRSSTPSTSPVLQ